MNPLPPVEVEPHPWRGLAWLTRRECHRVLKLWKQTILAPVISSLLFMVVFGLSLGDSIAEVNG
ncbi:MAG TPA: ABC transporter, partial [Solirubrobacterales bacterium]|nr:ABC transporter [Solirubrobacterales bacterium]